MSKIDLLEVHRDCLNYLLDYQSEHEGFYFVPRRINNAKKLESGMYFLGSDKYMMISFWDGEDAKERVHNISFGILNTGVAYIEMSSCDKEYRAEYLEQLVDLLESRLSPQYTFLKAGKWTYSYPETMDYIDALESFIKNEKPIIDDFIKSNPKSGIQMLSKEFDDKYVKTLLTKWGSDYKKFRAKKTGFTRVKTTEYIMKLQHNELSNEMVKWLKTNGYKDVVAEDEYIDITCKDKNNQTIFFELKTATSVRCAIREALGQLLEYNHYPNKNRADKLIIVTMMEMKKEDIQYLTGLRTIYRIPVWYQWFDMKKKALSKEY